MNDIKEQIDLFRKCFPDFKTFAQPGEAFLENEDRYKRGTAEFFQKQFGGWLKSNATAWSVTEFRKQLKSLLMEKIPGFEIQNFTNWRDNSVIFNELLKTDRDTQAFMSLLHPLLVAAQQNDVHDPLERLLNWLQEKKVPKALRKALVTLFLWLWNSDRFIFIKPRIFDRFLKRIGEATVSRMTADEYLRVLRVMTDLKKALQALNPRDMIDLQSFYYVVEGYQGEPEPGKESKEVKKPDVTEGRPMPLNLILYGPPGTGKTYETIRRSVALIDGEASEDDQQVKKRYDQLVEQSRIDFVTFHQSYSYEDFVEGIRPVMEEVGEAGIPRYECRDGIFKKMCALARSDASGTGAVDNADWGNLRVWKMSLGNTLDPEEAHIFENCIKGGFVAHGAGRGKDFKKDKNANDVRKALENEDWSNWPTTLRYDVGQIEALRNGMKKGDIVVVSYGNHYFRAIGRVTGDYKFNPDYAYPQQRPVKWLRIFKEPEPKERLLRSKAFSQLTLYPLATMDLKIDALRELLSAQGKPNSGKYVLIIDEINRGNISKILGELITLIEQDKRRGQPYALTVTLPYSQQQFSVPDNLCILGTMNTADKSIALVDVALRRRFQFEELMPNFGVCKGLTAEMRSVLHTLNQRILVRKDRDHQIGHAYFMKVSSVPDFDGVFARQIIPLLQEYFYNDWEGLRYVLGEENITNGTFIRTVQDGDRKWARTRWQWAANVGKVTILNQLSQNYSSGAPNDDQAGQSTN